MNCAIGIGPSTATIFRISASSGVMPSKARENCAVSAPQPPPSPSKGEGWGGDRDPLPTAARSTSPFQGEVSRASLKESAMTLAAQVARQLAARARWRPLEIVFWLAALASIFLLPSRHLILTEIAILGLFALSLDLILGYAGILSLGHAAFFGLGAYAAGLLAKYGLVGEPVLGAFAFDIAGHVAYVYSLSVLFLAFLAARRLMNSPFGLSLRAIKGNSLRASAIGIGVDARLVAIYTIAAGYAGIAGALLTQTTQFASLDVFSFERSADVLLVLILGGTGYLYGGMIGAVVFKLMQDALIDVTAQYWQFWIGLVLVLIVLGGERVKRLAAAAGGRIARLVGRRPKLDAKAP